MTPQQTNSMLVRHLSLHGEDVTLRRLTGTQQISFDAVCRAFVRGYKAAELFPNITKTQTKVIIGKEDIDRSGWPGPNSSATPTNIDRRIPRNGDRIVINGRTTVVEEAGGFYFGTDLLRIEIRVVG